MIDFLDLKKQHQTLKTELFEAFEKVYEDNAFSGGKYVEEFERAYSEYLECRETVAVSNGTTALHIAMIALGIGPGDEVILPANTFIATAWGISYVGAKPVFVDCDPQTWEIDPLKIEAAITSKTKAVVGVHLYGQPFDIDAVKKICNQNGLLMLEDAAQAQGAKYKGKMVGSFGEMACYSFYPAKNLGACGEGGAITTNSEKYAARLRTLRNHGSTQRYHHDELGFNYRMGGFEGASLRVKLKYLDQWNKRRREIAQRYQTEITNNKVTPQFQPEWAESVYHLFVAIAEDRDSFVNHLQKMGVNVGYHYPVPCHLQKAYAYLGHKKGDFPNSEYLAEHCVSLPMYPDLHYDDVQRVIDAVNAY